MAKIPFHLNYHTFGERLLDIVLTYSVITVFVLAAYPLLNQQLLLTVPVKVE
jgi:hypothetical protein